MMKLRKLVGENLSNLRKKNQLTQTELAEKLNYSDKSISKWENGSSLPGIEVLYELCLLYGVNLDYLTIDHSNENADIKFERKYNYHNIIASLSVSLVWFIATLLYVILNFCGHNLWIIYVWAISASSIVMIIFNAIWGVRKNTFNLSSILLWSLLTGIYLSLSKYNPWLIYICGIPIQASILIWARFDKIK